MAALPSPDYYLTNFQRLIDHAQQTYADVLSSADQTFIANYSCLSDAARRLYVRLLTRKGPYFRSDRVHYADIAEPLQAARELREVGLLSINERRDAGSLLALLRVDELAALARGLAVSKRRDDLVAAIAERWPAEWLSLLLTERFQWWRPRARLHVDRLAVLFFGNDRQHLETFVVSELEHVRYESYGWEGARRPFTDADAFERFFALTRMRTRHSDPVERLRVLLELPVEPLTRRRRERALMNLAEYFSQRHEPALGLLASRAVQSDAARERADILAHRLRGERRRRGPRFSPAIEALPAPATDVSVEQHVLAEYCRRGYNGAHLENALSHALLGLTCWDLVFADIPGAFFNAYQVGPADLHEADFVPAREPGFSNRFVQIADESIDWRQRVLATYRDKFGIANPFVAWSLVDADFLARVIAALPGKVVAAIGSRLVRDLRNQRVGFPDLTLLDPNGRIGFCEVKSLNDQLKDAQRDWLQFLCGLGVRAWIARPIQPLDVATTPSACSGAVKIRSEIELANGGGQCIEESSRL